MDISYKVKFFLLYLLLVTHNPIPVDSDEHQPDTPQDLHILNQHQLQVEKLEQLVKNLTELVSRLESRFSPVENKKYPLQEKNKLDQRKIDADESFGSRVGAVSVTKHSLFWSERFQFVAAVKLDTSATCVNFLPFKDFEGLSKYFAVGDGEGRVYVFLRYGDVMLEFQTLCSSPVTSMLSYMSIYKNESILVTGHGNGVILVHRVWETSNGEELGSLRMDNVGKYDLSEISEDGSPITILEVHHVGRTRYILSADVGGTIRVFRENGTVYGLAVPTRRPLAFLKQRLLFLTETGAGSLDLRTMKIRESECEGLNHSLARNYVFDTLEKAKAYGFTSEGDLIHVFLLGDIMNFKCRVRSKKRFEMDEPIALQAIKGYLLIVNQDKVFVHNVSSQNYVRGGGPRLLFSAGLDEIISSFLNYQAVDLDAQKGGVVPLVASDQEKLVILSLGSGYVGMYRSSLPVSKTEFNTILWSTPVLLFILFLFGAWQFFANKKDALTSWGPDDPFTSTSASSGAPIGSGSGDRSFTDSSSRNAEIMDLRGGGGGGLRGGPPRRFVSPSRYPGGASNSFRQQGPTDTNNSRPPSELKYRGSNLESSVFPKRRENSLYANNQLTDDGN